MGRKEGQGLGAVRRDEVMERVREIALPVVRALGLELVDIERHGSGPRSLFRVLIDKPGGVLLDDCEQVHVSLGHTLDVRDPIPHAYTLEVSSPGLDRPLKSKEAYLRVVGQPITVKLSTPQHKQGRVRGVLREVQESGIVVAVPLNKGEDLIQLGWDVIALSKLDILP